MREYGRKYSGTFSRTLSRINLLSQYTRVTDDDKRQTTQHMTLAELCNLIEKLKYNGSLSETQCILLFVYTRADRPTTERSDRFL